MEKFIIYHQFGENNFKMYLSRQFDRRKNAFYESFSNNTFCLKIFDSIEDAKKRLNGLIEEYKGLKFFIEPVSVE